MRACCWQRRGGGQEGRSDALQGKSFVITGRFSQYSREGLRAYLQAHGARLLSALSVQVDYLVRGDHAGPAKVAQAEKLGIEIIGEKAVEALVKSE